jgi:hypothetical protein
LKQKQFLREERRRLRIAIDQVEELKKSIEHIRRPDFIPEKVIELSKEKRIRINVGGLVSR